MNNILIKSPVIIIVSNLDVAGKNMKKTLLGTQNYQTKLINPPKSWPTGKYELLVSDTSAILTIPEDQIFSDYLADYLDCELVIFASKHSSSADIKTLTCHTTGIYGPKTIYGGNDNELAFAPSFALIKSYEKMKELASEDEYFSDYWLGIETTHHGPSAIKQPVLFLEVGGTIDQWRAEKPCSLIAMVIDYIVNIYATGKVDNGYKQAMIGVGGTHYTARHNSLMDEGQFMPGHIIPKYNHEHISEDIIIQMYDKTVAKDKIFVIDKKGTRSADRRKVIEIVEKNGWNWKFA